VSRVEGNLPACFSSVLLIDEGWAVTSDTARTHLAFPILHEGYRRPLNRTEARDSCGTPVTKTNLLYPSPDILRV